MAECIRRAATDMSCLRQSGTEPTQMRRTNLTIALSASILLAGLSQAAIAQDKLRIASGLKGTWENSFSELGQNAGFFKKHGIELEIFYTQGAGETQQAVISG